MPSGSEHQSAWAPLRHPLFRNRWLANIISNTGGWAQDTAGTWLMTSLTSSPLLIALMQTAGSLPVLFLGLPAGALADLVDRRKLLLFWNTWMAVVVLLLAGLTFAGLVAPWSLLLMTFLVAVGTAMNGPTWQAIVPELVPRSELANAVTLNSAGFNLSRAVGPALGGLTVAAFASAMTGAAWVFLFNAISFFAVVWVLFRWQRKPWHTSALPAEQLAGSIRTGIRYVRFSPALRAITTRCFTQVFSVSAMWALLAVVADRSLHHGAMGYGIFTACIGIGAIIGAIAAPRFRRHVSADLLVSASALVFVAVLLLMAWAPRPIVLIPTLLCAGVAWTASNSTFNVAAQLSVSPWVQARVLGIYQMCFLGGMAIGSAIWGMVAEHSSPAIALTAAAATLVLTLPLTMRWRLMESASHDHSSARLAESLGKAWPQLVIEPSHEQGPVLIEIEYLIEPRDRDDFVREAWNLRPIRRRDGAIRWGLYHDTADPARYVEMFVVESWLDHLRHLERFTNADNIQRDRVRAFHIGAEPPRLSRKIMERPRPIEPPG